MRIRIKRFDTSLPMPAYHTGGATGFDLFAREQVKIPPQEYRYVPLNVALEPPEDYFVILAARSSTHKKSLMMANGIGIIDPDFCGDEDEYRAIYFNFTNKPVTIERGERIAQGIFVKFARAEWDEVEQLKNKTRGGFGSTGSV